MQNSVFGPPAAFMKLFMKSYMQFANRYYVPFMFRFALNKSLKQDPNVMSASQLAKDIQYEQQQLLKSQSTRNFMIKEARERNMTDDSWLPLVCQYIASNRVVAKSLFEGDEIRAMLYIHDRALSPPVERMMRLVLGRKNQKGMLGSMLFRKPKENEREDQVDVLGNMWTLMCVANEMMQCWILSHEIYDESVQPSSRSSSSSGDAIRVSSIKVHDCMLNRFFKEHDSTHLMPVICSFDSVWARNAFENTGHKFRRNQTLSLGGTHCAFDFSKGFEENEKDVVLEELEKLRN